MEPATVSVPVPSIGAASDVGTAIGSASRATLSDIQRAVLPGAVRVTLELDREVAYHEERIAGPERVFFDLRGAQLAAPLTDKVLSYADDIVRQIRIGRHPNGTVRVVLDLDGVSRYSVFTLYNPFRLVIDCERGDAPIPVAAGHRHAAGARHGGTVAAMPRRPPIVDRGAEHGAAGGAPPPRPRSSRPSAAGPVDAGAFGRRREPPPAPAVPMANGAGGFSLARQLGLGVSRIVIDPGHGGHDPGAQRQRRQRGRAGARRRAAAREAAAEGSRASRWS